MSFFNHSSWKKVKKQTGNLSLGPTESDGYATYYIDGLKTNVRIYVKDLPDYVKTISKHTIHEN